MYKNKYWYKIFRDLNIYFVLNLTVSTTVTRNNICGTNRPARPVKHLDLTEDEFLFPFPYKGILSFFPL